MRRVVAPETLDSLEEHDPSAIRSRRDLQRVHRFMGTRSVVTRAFRSVCNGRPPASPLRILELGAGDGTLMLGVARALAGAYANVHLTLLDRQNLVAPATRAAYREMGWTAEPCVADALLWAGGDGNPDGSPTLAQGRWDLVIVNLFLHHFEGEPLALLLGAIANRADRFIACEPARSRLALAGSHLIGLIGAGPVTREDAVLSVHAGFYATEISKAWPGEASRWTVDERGAGLFSHCFIAQRADLAKTAAP